MWMGGTVPLGYDAKDRALVINDDEAATVRSVFAIFVEQMQNIIRYSAEQLPATANMDPEHKSGDLRYGILTIGQEGSDYVVHSGNLIRETDVAPIRERLTAIQAMTPDQLKAAYKDQLKGTPGENSKGAGIGLIEIARRASRPIEFDFSRIDNENFFFALKASI